MVTLGVAAEIYAFNTALKLSCKVHLKFELDSFCSRKQITGKCPPIAPPALCSIVVCGATIKVTPPPAPPFLRRGVSSFQLACCEGWNSMVPAVCGVLVGGLYLMDTVSIQSVRLPSIVYRCFSVSYLVIRRMLRYWCHVLV